MLLISISMRMKSIISSVTQQLSNNSLKWVWVQEFTLESLIYPNWISELPSEPQYSSYRKRENLPSKMSDFSIRNISTILLNSLGNLLLQRRGHMQLRNLNLDLTTLFVQSAENNLQITISTYFQQGIGGVFNLSIPSFLRLIKQSKMSLSNRKIKKRSY